MPEKKLFSAHTDVKRSRAIAPLADVAFDLAMRGDYGRAMTVNGFAYCGALGLPTEPMLSALQIGVRGVSLSGTGPSYAALVDAEHVDALAGGLGSFGRKSDKDANEQQKRIQGTRDMMGLAEHRKQIEKIDEALIRLIDQRIEISKKIFAAKRAEGRPISDPEREKLVLRQATDLAVELNLDAGAIRDIFGILISMSLDKQIELQGRNQG